MDPILKEAFLLLVKLARREYDAGRYVSPQAKDLILYLNGLAKAEITSWQTCGDTAEAHGELAGGADRRGVLPYQGVKPTIH